MKAIKYTGFIFLSLLLMAALNVQAAELKTSEGTEFVFSFSPNFSVPSKLTLFISSKTAASGVVDIPKLGAKIAFSTKPNIVTPVEIPVTMAGLPAGQKSTYGISVSADQLVSLYALNQQANTTDAFLVLPTHALGKNYMAATYAAPEGSVPAQVAIVGARDNTKIKITPKAQTTTGSAGVVQTITLNKMETFLLVGAGSADLTGTLIESDAPVAVTSGVKCAYVPVNVSACDHLVEMMPPLTAWGSVFVSNPLATRTKGDLIRVLSSADNTQIKFNGSLVATLAKGAYYDVITKEANIIETSNPALVIQYSLGQSYDGVISDPFMMLIPPTEQLLDTYVFATPATGFSAHYANVVIKAVSLGSVLLDGINPDLTLFKPIGDGAFYGAKIPISAGSHAISASGKFGLYVYGYGSYDSYGYPGGMSTEIINSVNGDYKNVKVVSTLGSKNIEIDSSSFTVLPKNIRTENDATVIEWFFPEFSIGQIKNLDFEIVAKNLLPGETRIVTNKLELIYQDLNGLEHRRTLGEQVLTVPFSGYALALAADKQTYVANDTVKITTTTTNLGSPQTLVAITTEIQDINGVVVAKLTEPPAFVLAGKTSLVLNPREFSVGNIYAGSYKAVAKMLSAQGQLLSTASTNFTVAASQEAIVASVSAFSDKISYTKKEVALIDALVKNTAKNSFVEDVTARIRIFAPEDSIFWNNAQAITQIAVGNEQSLHYQIPLVNATRGTYQLTTELITADGVVIATHQSSFVVVDAPLAEIKGDVSLGAPDIGVEESMSCTFVVSNVGDAPASNQKVNINLIRIDDATVLFTEQHSLNLVAGASEVLSPLLPAIQQAGNYACVSEAITSNASKIIGSAVFNVVKKQFPIKLVGDIQLGDKARLLVLMDTSTTERSYLENLLTNAGWFYTIVDNAAAFKTELTQGGYGVYALLSDKVTLDQATQNVLNAKVAAGDGMVVAGATDRRHQALEQALGIKVRANEAYAKGIAVQESALGYAWERAFNKSARVLSFSANGAAVIGEYRNNLPGADTQTLLGALGAAGRYGSLVLDDHTSLSSAIEGRMAVGGNLSLQNFSVGDKLDPNKLHDVVTVGGNVTFPSGRIYYGNLVAGGSVSGVGDAVRFGMAQGAVIRGNSALDINFTGEREYLQELSTKLATLPANGAVKMQWGGMELKGDCTSSSQIFNVNGADLGVAHTFAVSCIPAGATVVFNVSGTSVTLKSMGMQSLTALRDKVLFNFSQATSLTMTSVGVEGSILAPFAQVDQPAGRIDGQVMVKSWYSTNWGYMSVHNQFFGGDLSAAVSQTSKNALAIYQYQQGKTVFAGFDIVAQAAVLNVGDENPFAQLLLSALEHVNPAPITTRAGKTVPVVVTYGNTGAHAATGQLTLSITSNVSVIDAAAFTVVANTNNWVSPLSLDSGATRSQLLYVKLPESGSGNIQLQLQAGTAPDLKTLFEKALYLNVR